MRGGGSPFGATEHIFQTWLGSHETGILIPETVQTAATTVAAIANVSDIGAGQAHVYTIQPDGTTAAEKLIYQARITGQALNHTFAYPFGTGGDPASWLQAPDLGSIKAYLTQGTASADATIALLQARAY